jgi:hypothetical protein
MRSILAPAAAVAACLILAPAAASAETTAAAMQAFGLTGTWSTNCAGAFRVVYEVPAGGAPTVRVIEEGREIAASEIREILDRTDDQISWTSVITAWSLADQPDERWMPAPGEIWETGLAKLGGKIRPMHSQRQDGGKIAVKDGFIYTAEEPKPGGAVAWRNTGKATLPLQRCTAGIQPAGR